MIYENIHRVHNFKTIYKLQYTYLGGDVDLREFERTTAEDAILPAADGGIPFGPLLALPS